MGKKNLKDVEWQGRFAHQKAILFTEADFASKGTKFQVVKISPGGEIKPHYHKIRTEVFLVLQGSGIIILGNEELQCNVNDYMICKPPAAHAFINKGTEEFVVVVFRTNDPGDSDMLWVDAPSEN